MNAQAGPAEGRLSAQRGEGGDDESRTDGGGLGNDAVLERRKVLLDVHGRGALLELLGAEKGIDGLGEKK